MINVPTQTISQLLVNGNTSLTLTSSVANQTLSIAGAAATANLNIAAGSTLTLGSATATLTLQYATTATQTGTIAGTLTVNANNAFSASALTTAPGVTIASGGLINSNGGQVTGATTTGLTFASGSQYQHNSNGLNVPTATWQAGSMCSILSPTTGPAGGLTGQSFSNLTVNTGAAVTTGMTGAITVGANLQVQSGTFSDGGFQITGNGTGTLQVAAGATLQIGSGAASTTTFPTLYTTGNITLNAASTVNYNSTAGVSVAGAVGTVGPNTYGNLTLTGTAGTKTLTGAITVAGNLNVATGGETFTDNAFQITGNGTGTLNVAGGATLQIGSGTAAITTFPTNYLTGEHHGLNPTGTVNYNTITNGQTVAASIAGVGPATYGNLTVSGASGIKTVAGAITVAGNLLIATAGETLADGGNKITLNGNVLAGGGALYLDAPVQGSYT